MNMHLQKSIELAKNHDYLDRLYSVYPSSYNLRRNIDKTTLDRLQSLYENKDNLNLVKQALELKLFPIKDSYVAFLKRYPEAINRNPQTINRLAGIMYQIGWDKFLQNITEPKETNRQMGNKFSDWLSKKHLGLSPVPIEIFKNNNDNAILKASDEVAKRFAKESFGYSRNKGLDFVARFNGKYIIGEAKFLTDFGGHQNAQFEDALTTLNTKVNGAITVAILDGVIFVEGKNKMYRKLTQDYKDCNILSALLLRDFCYSV